MQAQHLDNATVLAIMALSTFVMERTVTALLFLWRRFTGLTPDPDGEGDYLLWYYALSTATYRFNSHPPTQEPATRP